MSNAVAGVSDTMYGVYNTAAGVPKTMHGVSNAVAGVSDTMHGVSYTVASVSSTVYGVSNTCTFPFTADADPDTDEASDPDDFSKIGPLKTREASGAKGYLSLPPSLSHSLSLSPPPPLSVALPGRSDHLDCVLSSLMRP